MRESFILFNHEIFNEQETLTDLVATPHYNVVADIEKKGDMKKGQNSVSKQKITVN